MDYVNCSGCLRRHPRPSGKINCPYVKAAKVKCAELLASESDYILFLPELDCVPETGRKGSVSEGEDSVIETLMSDSLSQRGKIDTLSKQVQELTLLLKTSMTLNTTSARGDATAAAGNLIGSTFNQQSSGAGQLIGAVGTQPTPSVSPFGHPPHQLGAGAQVTTFTPTVQPQWDTNWSFAPAGQGAVGQSMNLPGIPVTSAGVTPTQGTITTAVATAVTTTTSQTTGVPTGILTTAANRLPGGPFYGPSAGYPFGAPYTPMGPAVSYAPTAAYSPTTPPAAVYTPAGAGVGLWQGGSSCPWAPWPAVSPSQSQVAWIPMAPTTAKSKRKCVVFDLDPHLTCENVRNCTIDDVIAASMSLLECMLVKGYCVKAYAKHVRFLTDKSRVYSGTSLIKYDQAAREKAELLGPDTFTYGDHELYHVHLGLEHLKPKVRQGSGGVTGSQKSQKAKKSNVGLCWRFNEGRNCRKTLCPWKHECSSCGGSHKQLECTSDDK